MMNRISFQSGTPNDEPKNQNPNPLGIDHCMSPLNVKNEILNSFHRTPEKEIDFLKKSLANQISEKNWPSSHPNKETNLRSAKNIIIDNNFNMRRNSGSSYKDPSGQKKTGARSANHSHDDANFNNYRNQRGPNGQIPENGNANAHNFYNSGVMGLTGPGNPYIQNKYNSMSGMGIAACPNCNTNFYPNS